MPKSPFGERLRALRQEERKTLVFVAEALDCTVAHISAVERGLKNPPPEPGIERILRAFRRMDLFDEMRRLALRSRRTLEIPMQDQEEDVANMLASLARSCKEHRLTPETAQRINKLLEGGNDNAGSNR